MHDLYESIPSEHRPALNEADAGTEISLQIMGGSMTALGTTYLPFLLTDDTNQRVRVVLHTYVVPRLLMGMFLGTSSLSFDLTTQFGRGGPTFIAKFGQESCRFVGM
ncbi:hypothetical protein DXG01_004562 [Tephrocybe rancida]|nr:hypothetical protein DXG01_004562 [Tephrocybe rancida]